MSLSGNETGRAIYRRVASALASDKHQSLLVDHQTELDKLLETHELDSKYFSMRVRLQLHHAMNRQGSGTIRDPQDMPCTNIAASELRWLGQGIEEIHLTQAEISNALTQACQHGDAETALKLCNSLETFTPDSEKPSPLHWLIMFSDEIAEMLASALITGSSKRPGPCQACTNTFPSAGTGIFFHPEHCMDLFGTPLHWAVRTRNLKLVQTLITLGANINARWAGPQTWHSDVQKPLGLAMSPLDVAVGFHLPEIVAELLDLGAEISGGSPLGQPHSTFNCIGLACAPFSRFIIHGANARQAVTETIQVLVDHGFDICETDSNGYDPLMVALRDPDCELYILEELIAAGARPDRSTIDDQSNAAILVAQNSLIRRYRVATLELVSNHVININDLDTSGSNALHYAAIGGSGAAIEVLGRINTLDVNARTRPKENTALHLASTFGHVEAILSLHEIGANVELVDSSGMSALQMACLHRYSDAAEALMKSEAKIFFTSQDGSKRGSVLHFSTAHASSGDTILRRLIETHAVLRENQVINATDDSGWTAMHKATYFGDFDAVHVLLEYGADASLRSITGRTSLDECVKLLKQIKTRGLGIDHDRVRRLGSHAIASFVEYLREIKRSLEDHIKP
jgi:ankyrin repeat protein